MRPLLARLALVAVAALLVGCTPPGGDEVAEPSASDSEAAVADAQDPLALIGQWRVTDAAGEEPGTVVRIGVGAVQIWRGCGDVEGSWVANSTEMHAVVGGYSQTCDPLPTVTWLEDAASYEVAEQGVTIRSDDGRVVALLAPDDSPPPAERSGVGVIPTVVDDRTRVYFSGVLDWPSALEPAEAEDLTGRWVARGEFATDPHVVFSEGGRWAGTDGCNGAGGRWILDDGGSFASTTGAMTLIGCEGEQVPSWVMTARAAGMDGHELVLLDLDGDELGRLVRA